MDDIIWLSVFEFKLLNSADIFLSNKLGIPPSNFADDFLNWGVMEASQKVDFFIPIGDVDFGSGVFFWYFKWLICSLAIVDDDWYF